MLGLFSLYTLICPEERRLLVRVRIIHETQKAVLVDLPISKQWIPKSRIDGVRIKDKNFEFLLKESIIS